MTVRRSAIFALPLLLSSTVVLAEGPRKSPEATPVPCPPLNPQVEERAAKDAEARDQKSRSHTILGHEVTNEVTNEDDDLDVRVGKARTTSATSEPQRPDVIESRAEERREAQGRPWNVAPLFGYGTNNYNVGVGARAGYTFVTPIYVGGTFMYYFGGDGDGIGANGVTESRESFYYPAAEVGYDIGIGSVLVRPYGGAGVIFERTSTTRLGSTASDTDAAPLLYPGVTGQYMFPRSRFFVGGDTRVLIPLEKAGASFQLLATAGLSL